MNHFCKKHSIGIRGYFRRPRQQQPEPAKLTPPNLDTAQDTIISNGVLSTVDLISEGPIKGFTDINGYSVDANAKELGYALYFDGAPVFDTSGMQNFLRVSYQGKLGYADQSKLEKADRPPKDYNVQKAMYGPFLHAQSAKVGSGSYDQRPYANQNFTAWALPNSPNPSDPTNTLGIPVTHIIRDKYCVSFLISIGIQQLSDTSSTGTKYSGKPDPTLKDSGQLPRQQTQAIWYGLPYPNQYHEPVHKPERNI